MSSPPNSYPEAPQAAPPVAPPAPRPPEDPPWSGWDVLAITLVAIVVISIFALGAIFIASRTPMFKGMQLVLLARNPLVIVPAQAAAYLVVVAFMYAMVTRGRRQQFLPAIRWNFPHGVWAAFVALGVILAVSSQLLSSILPVPKSLPIDQFFRSPADAYTMSFFGVTIAPFVEELFFRGLLYPVLARRLGIAAAVILTALSFALVHSSQLGEAWGPLLVLFVVGMVLTAIRAVTKSVAASMLAHIGYNLTLFTMLFFASGHFHHLERVR